MVGNESHTDIDEDQDLAVLVELAAKGLVILPERSSTKRFQAERAPLGGQLASEMVIEDRQ